MSKTYGLYSISFTYDMVAIAPYCMHFTHGIYILILTKTKACNTKSSINTSERQINTISLSKKVNF